MSENLEQKQIYIIRQITPLYEEMFSIRIINIDFNLVFMMSFMYFVQRTHKTINEKVSPLQRASYLSENLELNLKIGYPDIILGVTQYVLTNIVFTRARH